MLKAKLWFALLWITLQALTLHANAQQSPEGSDASTNEAVKVLANAVIPPASNPTTPNSNSLLETKCILVQNTGILAGKFKENAQLTTGNEIVDCKAFGPDDKRLTGTGDIIIVIDRTAFDSAQQSKRDQPGRFILFLNGVALTNDATLLVSEAIDSSVLLRFRIQQGAETQKLWSILYADGALFKPQKLNAALGWSSVTGGEISIIPSRPKQTAEISLTTELRLYLSVLLMFLCISIIVWIGTTTDVLRDVSDTQIPLWWEDARKLKAHLSGLKDETERDSHLGSQYPNYKSELKQFYEHLAKLALRGNPVKDTDIEATKIGLSLKSDTWKPVPASYSLSRTQMALWFTFTVSTGIFLWMLYGDLRSVDGSLLVLLGISIGTAGVSWMADRNSDGERVYSPSRGLFLDLLTGFDERKQLHRYQAVVVNILLLVVGLYHVVQQLSYPTFDATWLIFLGISGSAYGLGKQILETKKE